MNICHLTTTKNKRTGYASLMVVFMGLPPTDACGDEKTGRGPLVACAASDFLYLGTCVFFLSSRALYNHHHTITISIASFEDPFPPVASILTASQKTNLQRRIASEVCHPYL